MCSEEHLHIPQLPSGSEVAARGRCRCRRACARIQGVRASRGTLTAARAVCNLCRAKMGSDRFSSSYIGKFSTVRRDCSALQIRGSSDPVGRSTLLAGGLHGGGEAGGVLFGDADCRPGATADKDGELQGAMELVVVFALALRGQTSTMKVRC